MMASLDTLVSEILQTGIITQTQELAISSIFLSKDLTQDQYEKLSQITDALHAGDVQFAS